MELYIIVPVTLFMKEVKTILKSVDGKTLSQSLLIKKVLLQSIMRSEILL